MPSATGPPPPSADPGRRPTSRAGLHFAISVRDVPCRPDPFVSDVRGEGSNEDTESPVRCADVGSSEIWPTSGMTLAGTAYEWETNQLCICGHLAAYSLLSTPRATDGTKGSPNQRGSSGDLMLPSAVQLLPTPVVNDMGDRPWAQKPGAWDAWIEKLKARHGNGNGNGHGPSLAIEAQRSQEQWGKYADAIQRWEDLTRKAPPPTEPGRNGNPRLSPAFTEWLMGLPAGWITDVPGITRNEALRLCGNGVVPQQGAAAIRYLLGEEPIHA